MRLFGGTDLVLYFFFYAFAAWVLETLFFSLKKQRFVNCGILDLPLLLTHGAAMANLILVSSGEMPERSRFLFGLVQTLAIGYLSEFFAERLLRKKRSALGRIKLRPNFMLRLLWALGLSAIYESLLIVVQPLLFSFISLLPVLALRIIAGVLMFVLLSDLVLVAVLARYVTDSAERQFLQMHKKKLGERLSEHLWDRVYREYRREAAALRMQSGNSARRAWSLRRASASENWSGCCFSVL